LQAGRKSGERQALVIGGLSVSVVVPVIASLHGTKQARVKKPISL
jgi:hypothetical protein